MSFPPGKLSQKKRKLDQRVPSEGSQNGQFPAPAMEFAGYPRYPYAYPYAQGHRAESSSAVPGEESTTGSEGTSSDGGRKSMKTRRGQAPYMWQGQHARGSKKGGYGLYPSMPPRPYPYADFTVAHYPFAHLRGHGVPRPPMDFASPSSSYPGYPMGVNRNLPEKEEASSSSSSASSRSSDSDEASRRMKTGPSRGKASGKKRKYTSIGQPPGHLGAPPVPAHYPLYHGRAAAGTPQMHPAVPMEYARGMGYPMPRPFHAPPGHPGYHAAPHHAGPGPSHGALPRKVARIDGKSANGKRAGSSSSDSGGSKEKSGGSRHGEMSVQGLRAGEPPGSVVPKPMMHPSHAGAAHARGPPSMYDYPPPQPYMGDHFYGRGYPKYGSYYSMYPPGAGGFPPPPSSYKPPVTPAEQKEPAALPVKRNLRLNSRSASGAPKRRVVRAATPATATRGKGTLSKGAKGGKKRTQSSKYRGVSWHKRDKAYVARVWVNGKSEHLGVFSSELGAALVVDKRLLSLHGPSAKNLNFPDAKTRKEIADQLNLETKRKLSMAKLQTAAASAATSSSTEPSKAAAEAGSGAEKTVAPKVPPTAEAKKPLTTSEKNLSIVSSPTITSLRKKAEGRGYDTKSSGSDKAAQLASNNGTSGSTAQGSVSQSSSNGNGNGHGHRSKGSSSSNQGNNSSDSNGNHNPGTSELGRRGSKRWKEPQKKNDSGSSGTTSSDYQSGYEGDSSNSSEDGAKKTGISARNRGREYVRAKAKPAPQPVAHQRGHMSPAKK